jgi:DNA polymerase (family 10)
VKGFGYKTEQKILADIEALLARGTETLLHEATREGDALLGHLRASPAVARVEIAGALRRRRETIDRLIAVAASDKGKADDALDHAARYPAAVTVLERDETRVLMRLPDGLNAEVHVQPAARFATAWHRLTGSEGHLAKLKVVAEARGLKLDESGLTRAGRRVPVKEEADLYSELELPFIEPELREDEGEVEAAVMGTLPAGLLRMDDVQGLVHCHTHYSDGKNSVEEMARGADALGMKYMTITDHSPTAHYAGGLPLDRLKRQWEDIARAQEKVKVRLLRGTESDILADGSLDYPDEVLEQLDVIVASVHNRHKMDADQMTRRIVTAMRRPQFKIWGHALGRYVLTRPPFAVHMETILDAVAESRAAVEINGDPHRLDMEPRWVRMARTRGIRFVVSTDAHSVERAGGTCAGRLLARRGWLTKADVLNTTASRFRQAVRPVKPHPRAARRALPAPPPRPTGARAARVPAEAGFARPRPRTAEWRALGEVFRSSAASISAASSATRASARPPADVPGVVVITTSEGLVSPESPVTLDRLRRWAAVPIDAGEARYRGPLRRDAELIDAAAGPECEVVLLGSIASGKYADVLLEVFGARLLFPSAFVGRGDMSRGGLMLRCTDSGQELDYVAVATSVRHGARPPRLQPRRRPRPAAG